MDNPRQGINMGRSRGRMAATHGRNDVQRPGLANNPNYSGTLMEIFRDVTPNIIPGKKSFARSRIAEFQQELIPGSISPVPNGTNGRSIALQANFFRLCDNKGWIVYEYLVEFIPPKETICSRKSCLKVHKERLGSFIFNGTVLYSTRLYPEESLMLESRRPKDNALLTIRLTLLRQVPIDDALSARICTELLHKCLSSLKMQIIGPNYYNPEKAFNVTEDRSNLEVWPGYMMKIEPCENELLLCIELTHKVIRCETMLDMLAIFRSRGIVGQYLQNSVRGMVVRTSYNNRCYRITGIDLDSTPYSTFKLPNGRLMSFIEFYQEKYELNIKHYEQPMLVSTFKCSSMGIEETVYLVPELCCITGLALDRIDMFLMRALSEKTNFKPQDHLGKVARFCDTLIKCTPAAEIFRKWGMDLVCEPVQFEGRVLTNEQVSVGSNSGQPSKVEFIGTDLTTFPMWVGVSLKSWIVVYPEEMEMDVRNYLTMLKKCASMLGMELSPPHMEEMPDDNAVTYSQHLDTVISLNMKPQIIVCVTNVNREDRYRAIKIKCCVENAVLSQQMLSNVYQGDTWKFAYIFLTKHSGARIFSRNGHNPPIGTVVDKCITRMNQYDFYLITAPIQSHTSFPTLYNVVWDNTGLNADKMQRLAYKLTHLYFNVKSTVRTPAPVRYAQRLVQLVCNHLKRPPNPDLSDCLYFL
ncbi:hypothetical protein B566_EDAN004892 [Ephemera danica]|nr:hypothetical protein B566_EDAN004892 [Ephemera danica]